MSGDLVQGSLAAKQNFAEGGRRRSRRTPGVSSSVKGEMSPQFSRNRLLLMVSLPVVFLDHATKYAIHHWTAEDWTRTVIPGFFDLVHRHNRGVAFSLLADHESPWVSTLLIAFALAMIALLAWMIGTGHAGGSRARAGLALILGGAAGNVLDRLFRGSVVDFADFYIGAYHYPAFNVADSAITIGACLVIFELLFVKEK